MKLKFTDLVVKGEFETYNIVIDYANGQDSEVRKITYGEKIGSLDIPEKIGYTFEKWVDESGKEVTKDTKITGPLNILAKYKINEYKISYELDGGKTTNPTTYTVEDEIVLNNPTRKGYTFSGWTGSNNDELQTRVTINEGTTGDLIFKANYSANTDTVYKVIHKYQNLDLETYTYVVEELNGATDTTVEPALLVKAGFDNPGLQELVIDGEGDSSVTYVYNRSRYTFNISDRTYVDSTSTNDGSYPYETEITLKAKNRSGYDFNWSDGNTDYERVIKIDNNLEITPVYTARTDTEYQVIHKKMNLDGTYTVADTENKIGTTDANVTPGLKTYVGFKQPELKTEKIKGDGTTKIVPEISDSIDNSELYRKMLVLQKVTGVNTTWAMGGFP